MSRVIRDAFLERARALHIVKADERERVFNTIWDETSWTPEAIANIEKLVKNYEDNPQGLKIVPVKEEIKPPAYLGETRELRAWRKSQAANKNGAELNKPKVVKVPPAETPHLEPKICPYCEVEFTPIHSRQITCGKPDCKAAHKKADSKSYHLKTRGPRFADTAEPRICPECGIEYRPKRKNQVTCGPECRHAYNNKRTLERHRAKQQPHEPRICQICQKPFVPRDKRSVVCSDPACQKERFRLAARRFNARKNPNAKPRAKVHRHVVSRVRFRAVDGRAYEAIGEIAIQIKVLNGELKEVENARLPSR